MNIFGIKFTIGGKHVSKDSLAKSILSGGLQPLRSQRGSDIDYNTPK